MVTLGETEERSGIFTPHEVSWTPERVRRFWAYFADGAEAHRTFFSGHSGDAIIAFAKRHIPFGGGRVLDYGCGPGFLLEKLLQRGIRAEGLEFSPESVSRARRRCEGSPLFGGITLADGVPTPVGDGSKDIIFLVEVLEHLPMNLMRQTLEDIRRILRIGGFLMVTTPHNEDLKILKTICPDCGCLFHAWQHVNSFSRENLRTLLGGYGMEEIVCTPTTFGVRWSGKALATLRLTLSRLGVTFTEPHLAYVGRRTR